MHKLMEYICDELEELERKADKEGKLSMSEIQYADTLAHMKKNLLKAEEMWEESEYSMAGGSRAGGSYEGGSYEGGGSYRGGSYRGGGQSGRGSYARGGRGRRRGGNQYGSYSMEGYSGANENMVEELRALMQESPDDRTRKEFERFIQKIEQGM